MGSDRLRNRRTGMNRVAPCVLVFGVAISVFSATAWPQAALPGCPFNLCALGVELGNAQGLARWGDPSSAEVCAAIRDHIVRAEGFLPLANRVCAQSPTPPWPVFQNWRVMQLNWDSFWEQYRRGRPWCGPTEGNPIIMDRVSPSHDGMNDSQFYFQLDSWWRNAATSLSYTAAAPGPGVEQVRVDMNNTCGGLYVAVGALLGHAQVTLQLRPASASYAYNDALSRYQAVLTQFASAQLPNEPRGVTRCGDFRAVLERIEPIFNHGLRMGRELVERADAARQNYLRACQAAGKEVESVVGPPGGWLKYIRSGARFNVVLDRVTGNIGTLAGGETYEVVFRNGAFAVTGRNLGSGMVGTWTYSNANVDAYQISLWGAIFTFNGRGEVFHSGALAGHLLQ